mgnify:CR=1 FL=1
MRGAAGWAVLTGVSGGIGRAAAVALQRAGYQVLGVDKDEGESAADCDAFLGFDLAEVGQSEIAGNDLLEKIRQRIGLEPLSLLVNNAAVQHLGPSQGLAWSDWIDTLYVNLSAPFALTRGLLPELRRSRGTVINVGSVHAKATKPNFVAYATSKSALHGLTQAMAVDVGPEVRVLCVAPAAIDTPMLRAGFQQRPEGLNELEAVHPLGRIGRPSDVGEAIVWLASPGAGFMSGSVLWLDGGIMSRLHDPD